MKNQTSVYYRILKTAVLGSVLFVSLKLFNGLTLPLMRKMEIQADTVVLTTQWSYAFLHAGLTIILFAFFWVYCSKITKLLMTWSRNFFSGPVMQIFKRDRFRNLTSFLSAHKVYKGISVLLLVMLLALIQTFTVWYYFGIKVDEASIFIYSIGFFGGDFNPYWFGYGSLGMYILYAVYMVTAFFPLHVQAFPSLEEYAMQVFYNGYFVILARYVFAVFGMASAFLYASIARKMNIPFWLICLYILAFLFSIDGVYYANHLRSDQLVGFFAALCIYLAFKAYQPRDFYFLALSTAAAICSKISALPMVAFLVAYSIFGLYSRILSIRHILGVILTFLLAMQLFQPYINWFTEIRELFISTAEGSPSAFNWGKEYFHNLNDRFMEIVSIFAYNLSWPVVFSLFFIVFARKYAKGLLPASFMLILLTAPYFFSPEVTEYWFLPAFNLVRFLSLLGAAGLLFSIKPQLEKILLPLSGSAKTKFLLRIPSLAVILITILFVIKPGYETYLNQYRFKDSHKQLARVWVEKNLLENAYIAIEPRYNHYLPEFYDKENLIESKRLSRFFIYNRDALNYFNQLFERYILNYYYERIGVDNVKGVRLHEEMPSSWKKQGYYYITSPEIYKRYMDRDFSEVPEGRQEELKQTREYFRRLLSFPLVKRFDGQLGPPVEIYFIQPVEG